MTAQKPQVQKPQKQQADPIQIRRQRALQGLAEGRYRVRPVAFVIENGGGKAYLVELEPEATCGCPDFINRAVRCKHIHLAEMLTAALGWQDGGQPQPAQPQARQTTEKPSETEKAGKAQPQKDANKKPGGIVITFGKYRGKTLAQVLEIEPGYVRWMANSVYIPPEFREAAQELLSQHFSRTQQPRSTQDRRNGGKKPLTMGFGKHKGKTLEQVAQEDPDYIRWLAESYEPRDGYGQAIQRKARALHAMRNADINTAVFPNA